jgi:hypothetical protein
MGTRLTILAYFAVCFLSLKAHAFSNLVCESSQGDYKVYLRFDFDESFLVWGKLRTTSEDFQYTGGTGGSRRWTGSPMQVPFKDGYSITAADDFHATLFHEGEVKSELLCCDPFGSDCNFKWLDAAD